MTHDLTPTKVAVLTGLTMLVGGAEISTADAATTTQTQNFFLNTSDVLPFNQFNPGAGNLTGVTWNLNSDINISGGELIDLSATVNVNFTTLFGPAINPGPFFGTVNPPIVPNDPFYVGPGVIPAALNLFADFFGECTTCSVTWNGALSLTYTYDPATQNAVPLPGALPLFATGMGALGLVGLHRRRKQKIKEQA